MNTFTPALNSIIHRTSADFNNRFVPKPVHVVQYDNGIPILAVSLYMDGKEYTIPNEAEMNIRFSKKDGTFVYNPALGCHSNRHVVYFEITQQMTVMCGKFTPIAEVVIGGDIAGSSNLYIEIDRNPIQVGDIESTAEFITIQEYASQALAAAEESNQYAEESKTSSAQAETYAQNAKTSESNSKNSEGKAKTYEANANISSTNAQEYASQALAAYQEILNADIGKFKTQLATENSVLQPISDSGGSLLIDSSGNNLNGQVIFAEFADIISINNAITALETVVKDFMTMTMLIPSRVAELEKVNIQSSARLSNLEGYALLDSNY